MIKNHNLDEKMIKNIPNFGEKHSNRVLYTTYKNQYSNKIILNRI